MRSPEEQLAGAEREREDLTRIADLLRAENRAHEKTIADLRAEAAVLRAVMRQVADELDEVPDHACPGFDCAVCSPNGKAEALRDAAGSG